MRKVLSLIAVLALLVGLNALVACGGGPDKKGGDTKAACSCGATKPANPSAACSCPDMKKAGHGWCEHCGGGLMDGKPTTCKQCATDGKMCSACVAKASGGTPAPK